MTATIGVYVEDIDATELRDAIRQTVASSGFSYPELQRFAQLDEFPSVSAKTTWLAVRGLMA